MQLLSTNDTNAVFAGLHCMLAICRMYRFKGGETRDDFNQIVAASFPRLLDIARELVQSTDMEAWEGLHIIMKTFKHTIYVWLPLYIGEGCSANIPQVRFTSPPHDPRSNIRLVLFVSNYCRQGSSSSSTGRGSG